MDILYSKAKHTQHIPQSSRFRAGDLSLLLVLHVLAPNEPTTGAPQAADLAQGLPAAVHPQGSLPQRPVQEGFWKGESAAVSTSAVPQGMQTSPTCSLAAATTSSRFKTHLKTNVCLPFDLFANGFQRRSGGAFVRLGSSMLHACAKVAVVFCVSSSRTRPTTTSRTLASLRTSPSCKASESSRPS